MRRTTQATVWEVLRRRGRRQGRLVAAFVLSHSTAACDVVAPPPVETEPPPPGYYASAPFPDVRSLNDVLLLEAGRGFAVGTDGTILALTTTDDGAVWTREESGTTADLESIDGFVDDEGNDVVLACGAAGTVLRRADGGWAAVTSGTDAVLFDVTLRGATDAFLVGDAGTILRYDGDVLTLQTTQTLQTLVGGACPDDGCGANSTCVDGVCHSEFPISEPLQGVGDTGVMIAVGARGAVYRYDANGEPTGASNRWVREDAGTQRPLAGIFTEAGTWVPSIDGVLLRRGGDGAWDDDSVRTPAPVFLQDVWVRDADVFAVGLSEDIYHLDAEGWSLVQVAPEAELRGVDGVVGDDGLEIVVVGAGGRIVRGPAALPTQRETLLEARRAP